MWRTIWETDCKDLMSKQKRIQENWAGLVKHTYTRSTQENRALRASLSHVRLHQKKSLWPSFVGVSSFLFSDSWAGLRSQWAIFLHYHLSVTGKSCRRRRSSQPSSPVAVPRKQNPRLPCGQLIVWFRNDFDVLNHWDVWLPLTT